MRAIRIAVNMQPVTDAAGGLSFRAAVPMGVLFEKAINQAEVEQERITLEGKYTELVHALRALRPTLHRNVRRNWELGNLIVTFEHETSDTLLFIDKLSDDLARDVNYSKTMLDLNRRFRLKLPDSNLLDPQISFSAYHRNGFNPIRSAAKRRQ